MLPDSIPTPARTDGGSIMEAIDRREDHPSISRLRDMQRRLHIIAVEVDAVLTQVDLEIQKLGEPS